MLNAEQQGLDDADKRGLARRHWGPYLSKRQSGTVRDGAGIGASHQTGWTGLVAVLPLPLRGTTPERVMARGRGGTPRRGTAQGNTARRRTAAAR